ncbi:hypothetical protein ACVWZA_004266 [Sphingomonas sp. UYAg733]
MPILRIAAMAGLMLCAAMVPPLKVTIQNRSGDVLRGVNLSPASSDHWGPERASDNIQDKSELAIVLPAPGCRWDVRVVLGDRPAEQLFRDRDLCKKPVLVVDGKSRGFLRGREPAQWN